MGLKSVDSIYSLYKGAFVSQEQPYLKAEQYWLNELATLKPQTIEQYKRYFSKFLEYTGKTADELLHERAEQVKSNDKHIQRRAETIFKSFLATVRPFYKPTTMQTIFASVRSFYEMHDYPLKMRKSDYPKGEALGVLRATTEATQKIFKNASIPTKALISTLNDTGLGVSDVRLLKCSIILDNPEAKIIHIRALRQKTGDTIHTFLGEEAIQTLKLYLELRRTGTRKTPPETITRDSPLFVTRKKTIPSRYCLSTTIATAFSKKGYKHTSAHSFRKKLQTTLEKSGMPTNWIDQILGHKLINSRDAYSLPTDEELQEAYEKAYELTRILPSKEPKEKPQENQPDIIEVTTLEEAKQAILRGYHQAGTFNGIGLYTK
jgi:site-specific recombinase XerD